MRFRTMGGLIIRANGKGFVESGNPRSEAVWDEAIEQLVSHELIQKRGYKGNLYAVTNVGYKIADSFGGDDAR